MLRNLGARRPVVRALAFLNEVLSLNAQESVVPDIMGIIGDILNEVLSLNAQESYASFPCSL